MIDAVESTLDANGRLAKAVSLLTYEASGSGEMQGERDDDIRYLDHAPCSPDAFNSSRIFAGCTLRTDAIVSVI